ncbi:hypothetical protein KFK09_008326 [Dendrobium nobile]|uniref:Uncharacterized protein n=1 Tax=Dendrobium nobile TaxID=94219 RepID=A0A8T3BPM8_DENNO|nr:hypothetical protein KFK09_008326 [Dendrobium nobile]
MNGRNIYIFSSSFPSCISMGTSWRGLLNFSRSCFIGMKSPVVLVELLFGSVDRMQETSGLRT